jgi:succinate dehydrogenase hydrophobic anchor subunit
MFLFRKKQEVRARTLFEIFSRSWQGINGAFFDFQPASLALLIVLGTWCFLRRSSNGVLLPILALATSILYGWYGWPHHIGTIFIALVAGLWIAWPTTEETKAFTTLEKRTHWVLTAMLVALLGYHVWNGAVIISNDYMLPYSGAEDAANYLKAVGADHQVILGIGYGMVGVEAYFDHPIEVNRPTAYFHHGARGTPPRHVADYNPDYIVMPCFQRCETVDDPLEDASLGTPLRYFLVHASRGYVLDKRGWYMRQDYFIYRKSVPIGSRNAVN